MLGNTDEKLEGELDRCLDGSKLGNADRKLEGLCDGTMLGKNDGELDRRMLRWLHAG